MTQTIRMSIVHTIKLAVISILEKYLKSRYIVPQVVKEASNALKIAGRLCFIICVTLSHSKSGKRRLMITPAVPINAVNDNGITYPNRAMCKGRRKNRIMTVFKLKISGIDKDK